LSIFNELKRRNVLRVAAAYIVVAWLLIQVAETIFPLFGFDDTPARIIVIVLAIGFVPAMVFAWVFEITPEGLKRDAEIARDHSTSEPAGKKLDRIILLMLALGLSYFAFDKFVLDPARDQSEFEIARQEGRTEALVQSYGDKSIAVLPFVDMSSDKDQEYMSDGIAEELLNLLAKIPELRVISRSSAFFFKGKEIEIPVVAQKLNVAYVLEGSVRKAGDQLRITAQLIEARSDTHIWSETYDRKLENIFQIQDEISTAITDSLKVHLLDEVHSLAESGRTENVEAYSAYLIGKERLALRTQDDIEAARTQFEKAIEMDPQFAPAHVQLAHAWLLLEFDLYGGNNSDPEKVDTIVTTHLEKALEFAPDLAEATGVQGYYHLHRYRYTQARTALDRAISLNPNYALAYTWRADTARQQKRYLDMLADREKAYSLDPMSLQISSDLAGEYRNFWRPKDAERIINRMFDLHPDHPLAYQAAALNLGMHGLSGEAQLMSEKALATHPDNKRFQQSIAIGLWFMGLFEELSALDIEYYNFSILMIERRYEDAKTLLDKIQQESPDSWPGYARRYYRVAGGEKRLEKLTDAVHQAITAADKRNSPWRERCNVSLIYDLRLVGEESAIESMMAKCHEEYEERLKAKYLCPCDWAGLVHYTILDKRIDEAIERAGQTLDNGWARFDLATDPIFSVLSDRPEYPGLLARNAEQIEHQRQIYMAGRNDSHVVKKD